MGAKRVVGAMVIAWSLVGCGAAEVESESPSLRTQVAELASPNGRNLNGRNLNGRNLNGRNLNGPELGRMLLGVDYAGATYGTPARSLDAVWLAGSTFHGRSGTRFVSGLDFVGARFTGRLGDGSTVALRVDSAAPGSGVDADVWSYGVSFRDEDGSWKPMCQDANGGALKAIAVAGRWDYRQGVPGEGGAKLDDPTAFTFACEGAAIAKCIHFGYKPWGTTAAGDSLAPYHQACTRMVRADFCGDGESHTIDGQWVNLYDAVGVQQDTESWAAEAEWSEGGARCFTSQTRAHTEVSCANVPTVSDCGAADHFSTGTLLMSESPYGMSTGTDALAP